MLVLLIALFMVDMGGQKEAASKHERKESTLGSSEVPSGTFTFHLQDFAALRDFAREVAQQSS
jgi:hypothetical protein